MVGFGSEGILRLLGMVVHVVILIFMEYYISNVLAGLVGGGKWWVVKIGVMLNLEPQCRDIIDFGAVFDIQPVWHRISDDDGVKDQEVICYTTCSIYTRACARHQFSDPYGAVTPDYALQESPQSHTLIGSLTARRYHGGPKIGPIHPGDS
ncbi:uncharacterized protein BO80DRAFT_141437 [Aspergillus ibericus CBS 121593]|uniref:Uncharacterized protein n=1 Tax=Aspergillus ibericus CBS 121593 TaxID=1448316 RepID=A0A395GX03_9EURO|nr:hypothetical protein BO80DRAFT_141437 [Aspergillus ibericus CBS 121593]RAK99217.1 hypothetical protein BO80DRAFT_141437 [Aspergillus ibericus CBS 121593]